MRIFFLAVLLLLPACVAKAQNFGVWLEEFKAEAASKGISKNVLDSAFDHVEPLDKVLVLDRKQPESTMTFTTYIHNIVSAKKVERAKDELNENRALLERISQKYGVAPEYIVALWGIESNFGDRMGDFRLVDSLATLAYDGRRSSYFRGELLKSLKIIQEENMNPNDFTGSWAGAMGQCQFMPTSFLTYAQDFDGDGKRDIWATKADVFASVANYLATVGWNNDLGWGFRVSVPDNVPEKWYKSKDERSLGEWNEAGVRGYGKKFPDNNNVMRLVFPDADNHKVAYLVTSNYKTIMNWNRSLLFATSVGTLADAIRE